MDLQASSLMSFVPWVAMALGSTTAGLLADSLVRRRRLGWAGLGRAGVGRVEPGWAEAFLAHTQTGAASARRGRVHGSCCQRS